MKEFTLLLKTSLMSAHMDSRLPLYKAFCFNLLTIFSKVSKHAITTRCSVSSLASEYIFGIRIFIFFSSATKEKIQIKINQKYQPVTTR